jgi:hypothetical protein
MTRMVHGDVSPRKSRRQKAPNPRESLATLVCRVGLRRAAALATWMVAAAALQLAVGKEFAETSRQVEERLELQILGSPAPVPSTVQPERTREESIEPWELVGV